MAKKVILASGSPRRKELLEQVGVEFEQRVSGKEERYTATEPKEIVKELAPGYAGGIMSAALDGAETAILCMAKYAKPN